MRIRANAKVYKKIQQENSFQTANALKIHINIIHWNNTHLPVQKSYNLGYKIKQKCTFSGIFCILFVTLLKHC